MAPADRIIDVADALLGPHYAPSGPVRIALSAGLVATVEPLDGPPPGPRRLAMPAPVNAHDHARPLSTNSFGAAGRPLETWLLSLAGMPAVDPGLAATAALGRAARGGVAGAMVHLTRPMGFTDLPTEARAVAKAAADVGIRAAFAVALKDRNPLVYGDHAPLLADLARENADAAALLSRMVGRPQPPPAEQVALVEDVAAAAGSPTFDVQFGPTGVQWCSDALLEAIARASAASGRRVHMHLLETRHQREWADATFAEGIVRHLARIGILSERLTLAHCVHARPEELEILADHGVTVAVNTSSNLHLKSGIAPVREMLARGVRVALGIDGCAFDEDDDALREVRLLKALHAGIGFEEGVSPEAALTAACATGRRSIGAPEGGVLAPGCPADLLILDLDALDRDAVMPVDPRDLLLARASAGHVAELVVAGRTVVEAGRVTGVDLPAVEEELRARYRAAMGDTAAFRAAFPLIEPRIAAFYRDRLGCS